MVIIKLVMARLFRLLKVDSLLEGCTLSVGMTLSIDIIITTELQVNYSPHTILQPPGLAEYKRQAIS